jgi:dephospho-CoA kinase
MTSIGLTGNIASGKSHIAHIFASLGVSTQDSDIVAHEILQSEAKAEVEAEFGTIDRKEIGKIVFANPEKLKKLEAILHPKVRAKNLEFIKKHKLSLIEIPLLFETNAEEIFDYVIFVNVSRETLQKRALARPNISPEKLENILQTQTKIPTAEKIRRSHFVIDNDDGADTLTQVKAIMGKICAK